MSYNIRDKRSFRSETEKIWENCEPSNFPFILLLYEGRRSVTKPKRSASLSYQPADYLIVKVFE